MILAEQKRCSPAVQGSDEKLKPRIREIGDNGWRFRGEWQERLSDHEKHAPSVQGSDGKRKPRIRKIGKGWRPLSWTAADEEGGRGE